MHTFLPQKKQFQGVPNKRRMDSLAYFSEMCRQGHGPYLDRRTRWALCARLTRLIIGNDENLITFDELLAQAAQSHERFVVIPSRLLIRNCHAHVSAEIHSCLGVRHSLDGVPQVIE